MPRGVGSVADVTVAHPTTDADGDFRIATVLRHALRFFAAERYSLLTLALVGYLPQLAKSFAEHRWVMSQVARLESGQEIDFVFLGYVKIVWTFLPFMLYLAFLAFASPWIAARLAGGEVEIGEGLRMGVANWRSSLWLAFVLAVALVAGTVVLVVPGLVVLSLFLVAMPAVGVERLASTEAWQRSLSLTAGQRWRTLALGLLVVVFVFASNWGLNHLFWDYLRHWAGDRPRLVFAVLWHALGVVQYVLGATLVTVAYHHLLRAEEQGAEEVVGVFE